MDEFIKMYPFNLAKDIFNDEEEAMKIYIPGLMKALNNIPERERDILHELYVDHMTQKACGQIHGISHDRISQLRFRSLRRLRHPDNSKLFRTVPILMYNEKKSEYYQLHVEYTILKKDFIFITERDEVAKELSKVNDYIKLLESPIEILHLTNEARWLLFENGRKTVQSVTNISYEDILDLSDHDVTIADDIVKCLKAYGLELRKEYR